MIASSTAISRDSAALTLDSQALDLQAEGRQAGAASPLSPNAQLSPSAQTSTSAQSSPNAQTIATNVRRLMAREGLTFSDVVSATGLDERTVRGLVRGTNNPHARTLHKFASGLGLAIDELFQPVGARARQAFDRATNPAVGSVIESVAQQNGDLFAAWSDTDFDELYSQFGAGGALNEAGVVAAAEAINAKRALLRKVAVILESSEAELLADFVKLLYRRVTVSVPSGDETPTPESL